MNFGSMNNVLVSVIICVYNGESYVEKSITSVIAQTHSNFQLIIVDDGSTDATPTIVDRFASTDTRIVVVHQQNAGVAAARQNGVNLAKGDYLMFVDADDWIDETMIDRMLCKATETSADMVWSDALFEIYKENEVLTKYKKTQKEESTDVWIRDLVLWESFGALWIWLFRTSLFRKPNVSFPENCIYAEDLPVIVSALLYSKRIAYLPEAHYHYRFANQASLTNQGSSHKRLDQGIILAIKHMEKVFRSTSNGEQYLESLMRAKLFTIRNYADDAGIRDYKRFVNTFPDAIEAMGNYPTYPRRLKCIAWCAKHKLYTIADLVRHFFGLLRHIHLSTVGDKEWIKCQ